MKHSNWKRLWSLVLTAAIVLSMLGTVGAAEPKSNGVQYEQIDSSKVTANLFANQTDISDSRPENFDADEMVRAMVVLKDPQVTFFGMMDESQIREDQQEALAETISEDILGGEELDVVWNLTDVTNAMSINVARGKLEEIRRLEGVKFVFLETKHDPLAASTKNTVAQNMTGASNVHTDIGVTGSGTRIAVIDTGTDTDHQSFDNGAYLESLRRQAQAKDMEFQAYLDSLNLLNVEKIKEVLPQLNAYERNKGLTAEALYLNEKLPFNYNYVDGDLDVTHDHDSQGSHGSHVAGIAAANSLLPTYYNFDNENALTDGDPQALMEYIVSGKPISNVNTADISGDGSITTYDVYLLMQMMENGEALTGAANMVGVTGVAPDAQLITMKVFGKKGGAYASDYIAALEDAKLLGCDVANLSLGGNVAGFTAEVPGGSTADAWAEMFFINEVMNGLADSDMVASMAVGNTGNWADYDGAYHYMYTDEAGTATASDPATFTNAFAVASADNVGSVTTEKTMVNGLEISVNPAGDGVNRVWKSLDQTEGEDGSVYDVVFLGDPSNLFAGQTQTDESIYAGEDIAEDLTGKVVLIARGKGPNYPDPDPNAGISFAEKHARADAAGAAAVIIYNNVSGVINASIEGSAGTAPCCTITKEQAKAIFEMSEPRKMTVCAGLFVDEGEDVKYPTMSDFSSWGTTGALTIKPEITAPGGDIYSINGVDPSGTAYETMGGTSMASPHVAGLAALADQYIRENGLLVKAQRVAGNDISLRVLTQSLLMSTARPMLEEASGVEYSVRNQGAGLANVEALTKADSFVMVDGQPDGKVKAELGDGTAPYSFSFKVYNLSDTEKTYMLDASILTTATLEKDGHKLVDDAMKKLDANVTMPDSVTVPAGGCQTVNVTIDVTDAAIRAMEADGYTNGFYVEGFVYVNGSDAVHSIPLLGWHGNWTDPSMYDTGSYIESVYGTSTRPSHVVAYSEMLKNTLAWSPVGSDNAYAYDGNVYSYKGADGMHRGDSAYNPDRNAFNSTEKASFAPTVLYPTMIRNAEAFKVEYRDHTTKEVLHEEVNYREYGGAPLYGSIFFPAAGEWVDVTPDYGLDLASWGFRDKNGNPIPEGTVVDIVLTTAPEYYVTKGTDGEGHLTADVAWDELGHGAEMSFTFRVDNTAPTLAEVDNPIALNGNTLTVCAHDENYIATVILMDGSAQEALEFFYPDMQTRGENCVQTIDLTAFREKYGNKVVIGISDYAGNQVFYGVNLGGEGASYGEFLAFQTRFDDMGLNNTKNWISFGKDVNANETTIFDNTIEVACAEYVNGLVFVEATDGKLYGIPYEDMLSNTVDLNKTYLATLTQVYQDIAYDYCTDELYGMYLTYDQWEDYYTTEIHNININGECERIDDYGESVTVMPYEETWFMGRGGTLGLGLAIDDEGSMYMMCLAYEEDEDWNEFLGDTAQLWKAERPQDEYGSYVFRFVGDTGLTMDYAQSITWNHNDEQLYWARFIPKNMFEFICELRQVPTVADDDDHIETTLCGKLSGETFGLMAPLTEDAAEMPEHKVDKMASIEVAARPILRDKNATMTIGSTRTLVYDLDPWYSKYKEVKWSSDAPAVVEVDQNGKVTAHAEGTAHIKVASKEDATKYDVCTVDVTTLNLNFNGTVANLMPGVGAGVGMIFPYAYTVKEGVTNFQIDNTKWVDCSDPDMDYGLSLACTTIGRDGYIWGSECGNTGMVYKLDPETYDVLEAWEPVSGDMLFGMTYSPKTDLYNCIMNMYIYADVPLRDKEKEHEEIVNSYSEETRQFEWHRLDMLEYLRSMDTYVTGEDGNGAMSETVFCGITQMDNDGSRSYSTTYRNYRNQMCGDNYEYTPDTTLVLLDNVGRLWYLDELTGMEFVDGQYQRDADDSYIVPGYHGEELSSIITLDNGDGTCSVFYLRAVEETPMTQLFKTGDMPRITYTFSDVKYVDDTEDGDAIFIVSMYDYWNDGLTNQLYLYVRGSEGRADRLMNLGDTGRYRFCASILDAEYINGLETTPETAPAAPSAVGIYIPENA